MTVLVSVCVCLRKIYILWAKKIIHANLQLSLKTYGTWAKKNKTTSDVNLCIYNTIAKLAVLKSHTG